MTETLSDTIHCTLGACSLGTFLVARTGRGICAVLLGEDEAALRQDLAGRFPNCRVERRDDALAGLGTRIARAIDEPSRPVPADLRLDLRGTDFQRRVWAALQGIGAGRVESYADVAARIGQPRAVRAVARACGANPVAVLIPCHRVVRSDGALSGYRWGVERKERLLAQERI